MSEGLPRFMRHAGSILEVRHEGIYLDLSTMRGLELLLY